VGRGDGWSGGGCGKLILPFEAIKEREESRPGAV
jgi:hypothetical protein